MNHLELGEFGEVLAVRYLKNLGWRIIDRNVRVAPGEIDIAAMEGGELVIVEVRTRRIGRMAPSETTVGPRKINVLLKSARKYVGSIAFGGNWRIDVVAVTIGGDGTPRIELFRDAAAGMEGGVV
ncbi:MAG: YraN family protein [Synergistaceae bacterium]|nr:YraN family protein [Synergistaceae bacterium]